MSIGLLVDKPYAHYLKKFDVSFTQFVGVYYYITYKSSISVAPFRRSPSVTPLRVGKGFSFIMCLVGFVILEKWLPYLFLMALRSVGDTFLRLLRIN